MVLSQRRGLSLEGCLTLGIENRLLLLLLQAADAGEGLQTRQLARLSLLPKAAKEPAKACLGLLLGQALLAIDAAEALLGARKLSGRAESRLPCAHARLLPELPKTREGLAKLGACAVKGACLLPEDAAKLLLRTEALLGSLPHLLGQALLCCKLLPCRGLQELAVALTCCQALLSGRAGHACKLLLGTKSLGCGLAKLSGKTLLSRKTLLGL